MSAQKIMLKTLLNGQKLNKPNDEMILIISMNNISKSKNWGRMKLLLN